MRACLCLVMCVLVSSGVCACDGCSLSWCTLSVLKIDVVIVVVTCVHCFARRLFDDCFGVGGRFVCLFVHLM